MNCFAVVQSCLGKGECLLVSVDDEGQFYSWNATSGDCLAMQSHPELAGSIGSVSRHLVSLSLFHSNYHNLDQESTQKHLTDWPSFAGPGW